MTATICGFQIETTLDHDIWRATATASGRLPCRGFGETEKAAIVVALNRATDLGPAR